MTKEITKTIILQEMQDKLKLREFEPSNFLFEETVMPVYDIEEHLKHATARLLSLSITSIGGKHVYTVDDNEKIYLNGYDVIFMASGAYTVAGIYISRVLKLSASATVYLDLTAAQSASYHISLPFPLALYPGDSIMVNVDGYTSTADLRIIFDYNREEIR